MLTACATTTPHTAQAMARAAAIIEQADQSGAQRADSASLSAAISELTEAQQAQKKNNMTHAGRFAKRAEVDAQLAAARGRTVSAEAAANAVSAGIETFKEEVTGPQAPVALDPEKQK